MDDTDIEHVRAYPAQTAREEVPGESGRKGKFPCHHWGAARGILQLTERSRLAFQLLEDSIPRLSERRGLPVGVPLFNAWRFGSCGETPSSVRVLRGGWLRSVGSASALFSERRTRNRTSMIPGMGQMSDLLGCDGVPTIK